MHLKWYALACVIASVLATASFIVGFFYFGTGAVFYGQWAPFVIFIFTVSAIYMMYWLDRVATEKEQEGI